MGGRVVYNLSMLNVAQKIEHLKKLGFTGDLSEVVKFYAGEKFNQNDANVQKLVATSAKLWREYSALLKQVAVAEPTAKPALTAKLNRLLDIAFPGKHGVFVNLCDGFYSTIGAVDFAEGNMCSINTNVQFGKYTRATMGTYNLIGEDVRIGATLDTKVQPNAKVTLGDDTWLCASVVIGAGATVTPGTVVGLGACVQPNQTTQGNALVLGNPATTKFIITDDYASKKNNLTGRSIEEINYIIYHLRGLGLPVDEAYLNALEGKDYNCLSSAFAQIVDFSHQRSYEFNHSNTTGERRREILKMLFPLCGRNFQVGRGLFVDVLGLARIGNNVQIGDNAFFAGNLTVGDDVRAGNNLVVAGIGHELPAKLRHLREFQGVTGEVCVIGNSSIADRCVLGNQVTLAPGCKLTQNVLDNTYVVGNNQCFKKVQPEQLKDDFVLTR